MLFPLHVIYSSIFHCEQKISILVHPPCFLSPSSSGFSAIFKITSEPDKRSMKPKSITIYSLKIKTSLECAFVELRTYRVSPVIQPIFFCFCHEVPKLLILP